MDRPAATLSRRSPRIVLLEDEQVFASLVEGIIRAWRGEVDFAIIEDGDAAWRDLCRKKPDLFMTDCFHPGLNGFEILRKLAEQKARLPAIWSGFPQEDPRDEEKALRSLRLLLRRKPYTVEELVQKLSDLLGPCDKAYFQRDLESYCKKVFARWEKAPSPLPSDKPAKVSESQTRTIVPL